MKRAMQEQAQQLRTLYEKDEQELHTTLQNRVKPLEQSGACEQSDTSKRLAVLFQFRKKLIS